MNFRIFLFIIFVVGIIMVILDISRSYYKCPKNRTIYKFIPRTFKEEQENPADVYDIFESMFSQPSPWVGTFGAYDERKAEEINKYFISQR